MRALLLCVCVACGAERFGDPAVPLVWSSAPRDIELIYSDSEDQTGMVFRSFQTMPSALGRLEVDVGDGEYRPLIDYMQPVDAVLDGVIGGAVFPGRHTLPLIRAVLPRPERSIDLTPKHTSFSTGTLSFSAAFIDDNAAVRATIADPMGSFKLGRLRRPFRTTVLDDGCLSPLASVEGDTLTPTVAVPPPLTDAGAYCVRVETGDRSLTQPLLTRPSLVQSTRTVAPEPLVAPTVVLPIVDLEIPDATRCAAVKASLFASMSAAIAAAGAVELEPIVLSRDETSDCRHPFMPMLDLAVVQERLLAPLSVPEPPIVLLVFIGNLDEPPAQSLFESYGAAAAWVTELGARLEIAVFAPPLFASFIPAVRAGTWTFALDPALPDALGTLVSDVVPFRRYAHPADAVLPFFPDGPPANAFGFKICVTNQEITPTVMTTPYADFTEPNPGFSFALETDWLPVFAFERREVTVDLEVCRRYCDRIQGQGWRMSTACGNTP